MNTELKRNGRIAQTRIYLCKLLRMFVYQSDWKVIPLGAVIAAVVTFVVGGNLFRTQEGTTNGAFALACACIWNGFFNSIQVVCRERKTIKHEHRAGLHISSYIAAHMIYQLILCLVQTIVTLLICRIAGVSFPVQGVVTPWGIVDLGITILLITFAADMLALMISSIVRTTTTAMTVMPFLLIFQLIFSGTFFQMTGFAEQLTKLTVSKWGIESICAIGRFNELPMVTLWNTMFRLKDVEFAEGKPVLALIQSIEQQGKMDEILQWSGSINQKAAYASTINNVLTTWGALLLLTAVAAIVSIAVLEFIDRDKR